MAWVYLGRNDRVIEIGVIRIGHRVTMVGLRWPATLLLWMGKLTILAVYLHSAAADQHATHSLIGPEDWMNCYWGG